MHQPKSMRTQVPAEVYLLRAKLADQRVTILVGAGFSKGDPSALPVAEELAQHLNNRFRLLFPTALESVKPTDLLAVAEAVAAAHDDGLRLMQQELASSGMRLDTASPNYAHRALALLFSEGLVRAVLSTNYATCVERAAASSACPLHVCRDATEMQAGGGRPKYVKLHGCVLLETSMRLTQAQLDSPSDWALTEVMQAVQSNAFVIIGISSVAPYIRTTLERVWDYAKSAESVWIVSPHVDHAAWESILGAGNAARMLDRTAESFLDDVLRSCVLNQFIELTNLADRLDDSRRKSGLQEWHRTAIASWHRCKSEVA